MASFLNVLFTNGGAGLHGRDKRGTTSLSGDQPVIFDRCRLNKTSVQDSSKWGGHGESEGKFENKGKVRNNP